jgi:steroid 5-alpha reductase family enzyme
MGVGPDFGAVGGSGQLQSVVGALLMIVLILAVLMLIVCAVTWGLSSSHGNHHTAAKARAGLLVSLGAAVLAGAGVAWMNFLLDLGSTL